MYKYIFQYNLIFSSFSSGPFSLTLILIVLITNTLLMLIKPRSPFEERGPEILKILLAYKPYMSILFLATTASIWFISSEQFGLFLTFSLGISFVYQSFNFYYIMKTPKLKRFALKTFHTSRTKDVLKFLGFIIESYYDSLIFLIFLGQMTTYPKRKDKPIQIIV